ncbi:LicD family protein [Anaerobutyricum soehngenii]|uniref:LicD family protein n=1 Tax=Anaerobutyricum soehngenii TaxID=105843 RepID=A0A6N7YJH2_9FIRM|nr:LicD family protein [Anaerobutyricum soehngenii]MSU82550.1 LicD family protein [Anaerobutyricum soehngenii]
MNAEQEKRKLQDTILIIAKEIDKICKENNIDYFMDGGTQLGAIRHRGFIPWDDDFDIGMKRIEYDRFINVCQQSLNKKKFHLETEKDIGYGFAFAKIHLKGTEIIENFSQNANVDHGIFVDIFPYDNIPDSDLKRTLFLAENHILKNLIWVKAGYGSAEQKRKLSYFVFSLVGKFFSLKWLKSRRSKLVCKYNNKITEYCFTSDYPKNHLQTKWLDNRKLYSFENLSFYGLIDYDSFLRMLYGNYMQLPPPEQRIVHSKYKIDFGPY